MDNNDPRNLFYTQRQPQKDESQQKSSQKPTSTESVPKGVINAEQLRQMQALAKKYEVGGEAQLIQDIVNNVIEEKAKGQLDNEQILMFSKRIMPLLNESQRAKLQGLVDDLVKL